MAVDGDESESHPHRLLELVREIAGFTVKGSGGESVFKKDCGDLVRRVSLLTHLMEEIKDFRGQFDGFEDGSSSSSTSVSGVWWSDLVVALKAAKCVLSNATNFRSVSTTDRTTRTITLQFQCVIMKMEQALAKIPYDQLEISEEVQEQVGLLRTQLRRAIERYGSMIGVHFTLPQAINEEIDVVWSGNRLCKSVNIADSIDKEVIEKLGCLSRSKSLKSLHPGMNQARKLKEGGISKNEDFAWRSMEDLRRADAAKFPQDFLCPISLELMRDPVIVATGQTYERSYIQRWIDSGNATCPKTRQKLENLTLTPNYVLRSLISQWCIDNNIEQATVLTNGRIRKSDGSFHDVSGDIEAIQALVQKLSSQSIEESKAAVSEIRSLSKRNTDNRILIAEAGAIPSLVTLLTSEDVLVQENAVTSILNLSIYENNKGLVMLAGAIPSIVHVVRAGSVEARENAAATLFSLSLADENKIIIGASGAIPALVELLEHGSSRGKKDAATALFNLCIYQGNKGRAVRAGIITALLKLLMDESNSMVDEALTIMSVLAGSQEAKVAIAKASGIPVLIDLLRTATPRNKENATAILLSLCKRDAENLACISRLGAVIPLTELARSGTERAKRKAMSMLEHLGKQ